MSTRSPTSSLCTSSTSSPSTSSPKRFFHETFAEKASSLGNASFVLKAKKAEERIAEFEAKRVKYDSIKVDKERELECDRSQTQEWILQLQFDREHEKEQHECEKEEHQI